ncbi:MAG: AIR synthase-related protein, partial [Marmoricola sp.]
LPAGIEAVVDRSTWAPQPIFELIAQTGPVDRAQLELTFNLGVGMVAVVPAERAQEALDLAGERGVPAWRLGELRASDAPAGTVTLRGDYLGGAGAWR